jgi:hypothetical protein
MSALARAIQWMLAVSGLALALGLILAPAEWLFEAPLRAEAEARARLVQRLTGRSGLLCALTFDEPTPCEFVTGKPVIHSGTVAGPGRYGQARKFDGRERTQIETPMKWNRLGPAFTLSFWVKMPRGRANQCIWYRADAHGRQGFHLEDGQMTFDMPGGEQRQCMAYPFERYGQFVHLAATVDSQQGKMVLYENGRPKAESRLESSAQSLANMGFGKPLWYATRNPFRGWIDEATIWKRILSDKEVRRLARSKRGVLRAWGGRGYIKWQMAQGWARILRASAGLFDFAVPFTPQGHREMKATHQLPELRLILSGKVRRELIAAHHRSRKSGRRTQAGAKPRLVHVAFEGAVYPAHLCLAGGDMEYADGARAGYELNLQDGAKVLGAGRLLLRPPENGDWLFPLADSRIRKRLGLPVVPNGLCRVRLNGLAGGVYLFSNHERGGFLPGDSRNASTDNIRAHRQWTRIFQKNVRKEWMPATRRPSWPLSQSALESIYDSIVDEWGGCLRGDLQNLLSRKEVAWRLKQGRARIASLWPSARAEQPRAQQIAEFLDEFMVLGSNASPDRLVASLDLELQSFKRMGVDIRWSSTHPSALGPDGTVHRPLEGGPVGAQLVATIQDGKVTAEKSLTFRVMPQRIALPTLFLNVRNALDKTRRVDAMVEVCEPGEDFPARVLFASQGARGGIEHRGNTSYINDKKLFSLKTDEPHRILDESERRVLLAVNSEQDTTFVLNQLAFELFQSWGTAAAPRLAPKTRYAEVFMNGRYHGLYELATRIDEMLLDEVFPAPAGDAADLRWIIYRLESVSPRTPDMRARQPGEQQGDYAGPYRDLCRFLERPTDEAWERELAGRVDLSNLADFQLLLNLFQNTNGAPFPYLMHEGLVYDMLNQLFFNVPWDFEATTVLGIWEWRQNQLMTRLENESPAYRARLASRWRELRERGGVTPEALEARIDQIAQPLHGYVAWDYLRWNTNPGRGFESDLDNVRLLDNLKLVLRQSIVRMDEYLGK